MNASACRRAIIATVLLALSFLSFRSVIWNRTSGIDIAMNATVIISGKSSSGAGFFYSREGCIMTAHHVVSGMVKKDEKIYIKRFGDQHKHLAHYVRGSESLDMAIICTNHNLAPTHLPTVIMTDGLKQGEKVFTVGHPRQHKWVLSDGIISQMRYIDAYPLSGEGVTFQRFMIYTTASINNGNSGGPLIDKSGNVVGMIVLYDFMGTSHPMKMNLAVPGTELLRYIGNP